uniref:Uncharacterized protein n=1 Tax=Pristionchus pacificus TaxID=54126 RepID=A0A2A6CP58_PRIPA|eukprot:PDM79886.1 hypothetical protein PRIPAC_32465 [Pristionchus pacificus]
MSMKTAAPEQQQDAPKLVIAVAIVVRTTPIVIFRTSATLLLFVSLCWKLGKQYLNFFATENGCQVD